MYTQDTDIRIRPRFSARIALFALALLAAGGAAWGATVYTWTGGGGSNTNWSDTANWSSNPSGGTYPGASASDIAYIDGSYTVTLDANLTIATLYFNYNNANPATLNLNGKTLTVTGTVNFGQSGNVSAPACNASIVGPGAVNCTTIDTNENTTNQVTLSNNVAITASGTFYGDQTSGTATIFNGDGTCSISAASFYVSNGTTYAGIVMNDMKVTSGGYTYYSPTLSASPAAASTITVSVTGTFPASTFQYTRAYTNNNSTTTESYTLQAVGGANPVALTSTSSTRTNFAFASSANSFQFQIVYPSTVDAGDGIDITVYTPSGISLGTIPFTQSSTSTTTTWTGGAGTQDWGTALNWSNGVPTSSMDAVINSGTVKLISASGSAKSVTLASGATLDLNGYNLTGLFTFTNNGTVRLKGTESVGGTKINGTSSTVEYYGATSGTPIWGSSYQNLTVSAGTLSLTAATTTVAGTLTNGASINVGSDKLSFAQYAGSSDTVGVSGGTVAYTGTAAAATITTLSVGSSGATLAGGSGSGLAITTLSGSSVPITTSGAVTLNSTGLSSLTVSSGTLTLNGNTSVGGPLTVSTSGANFKTSGNNLSVTGASNFTNATLTIGGTETLTFGGNLTLGTLSNATGATFAFDGSGAQTITPNAQTFGAVQMTGTGGVAMVGTATFGNLSVSSGEALTLGGGTATSLTVNGAFANGGATTLQSTAAAAPCTLTMGSGTTLSNSGSLGVTSSTGTVTLAGASATATTTTFALTGNALSIASGCALTLSGMSTAVAQTLGANETINLGAAAIFSNATAGLVLNGSGAAVKVGSSTLTVTNPTITQGTMSVGAGSLAAGTSALTIGSGGALNVTGTGSVTAGALTNAGSATWSGGGTASLSSASNTGTIAFTTTATPAWTVSGIFTSSGTITNSVANTISVGGNLSVSGTFGGTATDSTITMGGASATIDTATQIGNLVVASSATTGIVVATSALNLAGYLTVQSGGILSDAANSLGMTVAGACTANGSLVGGTADTLTLNGAAVAFAASAFTPGTSLVKIDGAGVTFNPSGVSFYDLTIGGTVSTLSSGFTVSHAFSIGSSGSLAAGANTITIDGSWTNGGTFTPGSSSVVFGSGTHAIGGATSFYNLKDTASGSTLTFAAGQAFTVSGLLTLTGSSGSLVAIQSSVSGTSWSLNNTGTNSVSYVAVSDSTATTASVNATDSIDETGNNTNWVFGAISWTGGAGTTSTSTGGNWATGVVPGQHDSVTVPSVTYEPVQDAAMSLKAVALSAAASTWSNGGYNLTVGSGGVANSGTFTYTGSGTMSLNTVSFGGTFAYSGGTVSLLSGITSYTNLTVSGGAISAIATASVSGTTTVSGGTLSVPTGTTFAAGTYAGTGGTLDLVGSGSTVNCGAFTVSSGGVANDANGTAINASGSVSVTGGTFGNPAYDTLTMSGSGTSLDASVTLGNVSIAPGSGNTVSLSSNSPTLAGNLLLTSGILNMGSSLSMSVAGNITRTSGYITSSGTSGTITLDGSGATQTADFTGSTIPNLGMDNTYATPTVTLDNTAAFTWNGGAGFTAGTLVLASYAQTIGGSVTGSGTLDASAVASGTTLTVSGSVGSSGTALTALVAPAGTLSVGGSAWNVGTFTSSSGTVAFMGTGTMYSGTSFYNLTRIGASSTTTVNSGITIVVSNSITLSSGTLALSGSGGLSASGLAFTVPTGVTVTVGTGTFVVGAMMVSGGSFAQTGNNATASGGPYTQSVAGLTVSGGTCQLDSGNAGGSLTVGGGIMQSGGTLSLGSKSVSATTMSVSTSGSTDLALGSAAVTLSSAPNAIAATTLSDTASTITLNGAGNLTLDAANSIGNLVAGANTTLLSTHTAAAVKAFTVNGGITFTAATDTFRTSGNATLAGTYSESSGSLYVGGALSVASTGSFASSGAGLLSVTGTTTNAGTIDSSSGSGTVSFGSTYGQTAGSLAGGAGLVTFTGAATHSGGTITSGSGGLQFDSSYTGTGGTLNGLSGATITFDGNTTLGTFTHNNALVAFFGSALQTFDSNGQLVGNVVMANSVGVELLNNSVRQTGALYTLTIQSGYLDLHAASLGWVADSAATLPTADTFHGAVGNLILESGTELICGNLAIDSGYVVTNSGANTISIAGSAVIACASASFTAPTNSTIDMTGTGTLTAKDSSNNPVLIGNLTVSGSTTLGAALSMAGNMTIGSSGVLDVSSSNWAITIDGNWTNNNGASGFVMENGTVTFSKPMASGAISIQGSTTWWNFVCTIAGQTIQFGNNPSVHTFTNNITITGTSGSHITLTRYTSGADPIDPTNPAQATLFWDIDVKPSATLNLTYVDIYYSNAYLHPIIATSTVTVSPFSSHWCYKWLSGLELVYSYTEDSDHDGKIDRIRVQAAAAINGNFTGLTVAVSGYTVTGYSRPSLTVDPSGTNFYILLKELAANDTSATPSWYIVSNTTLADQSTGTKFAQIYTDPDPMVPLDTAAPLVTYTLASPAKDSIFVHLSEPIEAANSPSFSISSGSVSSTVYWISSTTPITTPVAGGVSEYLLGVTPTMDLRDIASGSTTITLSNGEDFSGASTPTCDPTNSSYPYTLNISLPQASFPVASGDYSSYVTAASAPAPNVAIDTTHRISDVLVSEPMVNATDTTYFVWPIYAKDKVQLSLTDAEIAALTPAQTAAQGIGLIRAFDDSQWLRAQNITLQARLQGAFSPSNVTLWFDSGVPSSLQSSGLWLPSFSESGFLGGFSGLVPYPNASPLNRGASQSAGSSIGSGLWNFSLPASDPRIASVSTLGFFFTLDNGSNSTDPLYVARLDIPAGTSVPSNWYRLVKPFEFDIHDLRLQRGGASILNNVIDPTRGETARLSYQLPSDGDVTVTVFTLDGDVVRRLVLATQAAGDYSVDWDGTNMSGHPVARGIYFIRIVAPNIDEIRKVLVVRK